ncbi:MAG: hypothetical protein IPP48_02345 [Chitinophagaceae bacterium]|nr:hypothetical protein [Chitinophagaceae bacterium]
MKKVNLLLIFLSIQYLTTAQPSTNNPNLGKKILAEQVENIKEHNGKVDCINYWNIAVAYRHLGVSKDSIYANLYKSMEDNPSKFIETVEFAISYSDNNIQNVGFYKILGSKFLDLVETGKKKAGTQLQQESKITNIINQKVVDTLIAMMILDQQYRKDPFFLKNKEVQRKQYILDSLNGIKLYRLYKEYGYPGKSITGDNEYQNYFCLMVEHGQNKTGEQRFWLPIIAEALKKKELGTAIFKMLLDRVHWLETGKQYFGSHHDVPLDSDESIEKIKMQYGL